MIASKAIKLNTGALVPLLGFGTRDIQRDCVEEIVRFAVQNGYRHIDTATNFGNEKEIGSGINNSGVPRSEIFLTTKLDNSDHRDVEGALFRSVEALGTYVDLWLMNWPAPQTKDGKVDLQTDWLDTWKTMEAVSKKHSDKVKAIGVSNFSQEYLERLLANATLIPAANQIELHPACPQEALVAYCRVNGIALIAHSPLGSEDSALFALGPVQNLAKKYSVSPANILISLQASSPHTSVVVGSSDPAHILENFRVFILRGDEISELRDIYKTVQFRVHGPDLTGYGHLGFPDFMQDLFQRYPQDGYYK